MSYPLTSRPVAGPRATEADEAEYDRLRGLARNEHSQRAALSKRSQEAYKRGDGALAKELSEQAKAHQQKADDYNRQARDWIFRANNAGRAGDELDLHGLYVDEAVEIVGERMREERRRGGAGVWVIVGKGNHSQDGIAKIKPAVEEFCRREGLNATVDPKNSGRVWIALDGQQGGQEEGSSLGKILGFVFGKLQERCCIIM